MRISDLIVRDWVVDSNNHPIQLDGESICALLKTPNNNLSPVPITSEILKKNGFKIIGKYDEEGNHTNDAAGVLKTEKYSILIHLLPEDNYASIISNFKTTYLEEKSIRLPIKYVHSLQHALYMVGLRELSDNFKV